MPPQAWFADDSQAAGRLEALRLWWDTLYVHGPAYGYFPKPSKTFLVVKPGLHESARKIFAGTGIQISEGSGDDPTGGQRDLGAAIGSKRFVADYLAKKIAKWTSQVERLAEIAMTQPQPTPALCSGFATNGRIRNVQ
jgi:hypothetical protein